MSENLQKRPAKGILKNSSSFDKQESQPSAKRTKETKWDEMNIIATYHPPGKEYGHMKIDEPKTPYSYDVDMVDNATLNPEELARRIKIAAEKPPKFCDTEADSTDEEEEETEEEQQKRKEFELKRKKHYNEFHALQLAKKLLEEEEDDEVEEGDSTKCQQASSGSTH
ncbi:hypothetical protein HUJ04_001215 [Dendroctonus ponderosae]